MANIEGGGGGRQTNFELNLVPFIDLMSVMITFLLITAVWTQVSMIQLGSSLYAKKNQETKAEPPKMDEVAFRVDVREDGYRVLVGTNLMKIPKANGDYDLASLKARIDQVKTAYQEKESVVITMEDTIVYNELIRGMDILLKSGFPSISVATGGAQ